MTEQELRAVFSVNVRRYRHYHKFSQAALAEKLGISIPFLSDIENNRKWVSPATLVKFAEALKVEPYELFRPTGTLPPNMAKVFAKWSDEVVKSVTQSVREIQEYYLIPGERT